MLQVREIPRRLWRWKRRIKVHSRSFILYRDYSNSFTLLANSPEVEAPRQGNVKKKRKKEREKKSKKKKISMHGQIQDLLGFYQSYSHHLVRCYPLTWSFPSTLYFVNLAIFFTWVSCLTPNLGLWSKNKPSEISKDDPKRINALFLRFCFKYILAF